MKRRKIFNAIVATVIILELVATDTVVFAKENGTLISGTAELETFEEEEQEYPVPEETISPVTSPSATANSTPDETNQLDAEETIAPTVSPSMSAEPSTIGEPEETPETSMEDENEIVVVNEEALISETTDNISVDELNFPDTVFREWVSKNADTNSDGVLSTAEKAAVTAIDISNTTNNPVSNMKGIEYFTELQSLECSYNDLTELDISSCTDLRSLRCNGNQLIELDLNSCVKLEEVYAVGNKLTKLLMDKCTKANIIYCGSNRLLGVNVPDVEDSIAFQLDLYDEVYYSTTNSVDFDDFGLNTSRIRNLNGATISGSTLILDEPVVTYEYAVYKDVTFEFTIYDLSQMSAVVSYEGSLDGVGSIEITTPVGFSETDKITEYDVYRSIAGESSKYIATQKRNGLSGNADNYKDETEEGIKAALEGSQISYYVVPKDEEGTEYAQSNVVTNAGTYYDVINYAVYPEDNSSETMVEEIVIHPGKTIMLTLKGKVVGDDILTEDFTYDNISVQYQLFDAPNSVTGQVITDTACLELSQNRIEDYQIKVRCNAMDDATYYLYESISLSTPEKEGVLSRNIFIPIRISSQTDDEQ